MTQGQSSLNVKDFPFALSLAVLIFPGFLITDDSVPQENAKNPDLIPIVGITIFGGVLGSLLTITNPGGYGCKLRYRSFAKDVSKETFDITREKNPFIFGVTKTNYYSGLSSPSISFEIDKIVGIIYFIILLIITEIRLHSGDLVKTLLLTYNNLIYAEIIVICALVGTLIILVITIFGVNKRSVRSISLYTKIKFVAVLLTARDLINLELYSKKLRIPLHRSGAIMLPFFKCLLDFDTKKTIEGIETTKSFGDLLNSYNERGMERNIKRTKNDIKTLHFELDQIRKKYDLKMKDICLWLYTESETDYYKLDGLLSELQTSIDGRDWHNSELITIRINHSLKDLMASREWKEIS